MSNSSERVPSASDIRRAKLKAVGGKRKRCVKGKSCSAACIQATDACLVVMPDSVGEALSKRQKMGGAKPQGVSLRSEIAALNKLASDQTRALTELRAREKELDDKAIKLKVAKDKEGYKATSKELRAIQKQLKTETASWYATMEKLAAKREEAKAQVPQTKPKPEVKIPPPKTPPKVQAIGNTVFDKLANKQIDDWEVKGQVDPGKVKWGELLRVGSRIGKGEYAEALAVPPDKLGSKTLAQRFPNGIVLKKGEVGDFEPDALKKAGDAGIAPRLLASRVSFQKASNLPSALYNGLIAMERIEGVTLFEAVESGRFPNAYNLYWAARAKIHRLGIAHNDAHNGNFLIDSSGRGKFIDFGLAVLSPKNALSEGIGGITGSDGQTAYNSRSGDVFNRIVRNVGTMKTAMKEDGFTDDEIRRFERTGNYPGVLTAGAWPRMTDSQASRYLSLLYDGV